MENEEVFEATHRLVLELVAEGKIDGLRIDHPDGLYDPASYFRRLQARVAAVHRPTMAPRPLYLVVEKITASTSTCRGTGRCTAPPATTSPTRQPHVGRLGDAHTHGPRVPRFIGEPLELARTWPTNAST